MGHVGQTQPAALSHVYDVATHNATVNRTMMDVRLRQVATTCPLSC